MTSQLHMTHVSARKGLRRGEQDEIGIPQRRQRFYAIDSQWYFRLRGEDDRGPFASYAKARNELALYLRRSGVVRFTL